MLLLLGFCYSHHDLQRLRLLQLWLRLLICSTLCWDRFVRPLFGALSLVFGLVLENRVSYFWNSFPIVPSYFELGSVLEFARPRYLMVTVVDFGGPSLRSWSSRSGSTMIPFRSISSIFYRATLDLLIRQIVLPVALRHRYF